MEMTPREIAANLRYAIDREQRQIANLAYAVRLGMAADEKKFASAIEKLTDDI